MRVIADKVEIDDKKTKDFFSREALINSCISL